MLRRANDILGCTLHARDGEIGRVKDFYFDDAAWVIRYLVADTRKWLSGRKVLLSPFAVKGVAEADKMVDIDLTRQQITDSPSIDEHLPISRQFESEYYKYYQWPMYWQGAGLWGPLSQPIAGYGYAGELPPNPEKKAEPHLRAHSEVMGYHIHATDGEIGHVEDLAFDAADWAIRYLVVDTKNWWAGKKVIVPVAWVRNISFERSQVEVDITRDMIQRSPEYDFSNPISRDYEARLYEHYNRQPYWSEHRDLAA